MQRLRLAANLRQFLRDCMPCRTDDAQNSYWYLVFQWNSLNIHCWRRAPYPRESDVRQRHKGVCWLGVMDIGRSRVSLQYVAVLVCYYIAFHAFDSLITMNSFCKRGCADRELWLSIAPIVGAEGISLLGAERLYKTVFKFYERIHRYPESEVISSVYIMSEFESWVKLQGKRMSRLSCENVLVG